METELKLSLNEADAPALRSHPLLIGTSDTLDLLNTYFDTPGLDLQRARMAVRERLSGSDWLLTVKTAGSSVGGLSRRQEWEGPTIPGKLDFAALVDDPALAAQLMTWRAELRPLFCTDFERQRWVITHAGAQIEVALDRGDIRVPGTALRAPILELELELLSGPDTALQALAQALRQSPGGSLLLTPCDTSKAQRGMALWRQSN
jgi:inorganic triphosphatase YgiF